MNSSFDRIILDVAKNILCYYIVARAFTIFSILKSNFLNYSQILKSRNMTAEIILIYKSLNVVWKKYIYMISALSRASRNPLHISSTYFLSLQVTFMPQLWRKMKFSTPEMWSYAWNITCKIFQMCNSLLFKILTKVLHTCC